MSGRQPANSDRDMRSCTCASAPTYVDVHAQVNSPQSLGLPPLAGPVGPPLTKFGLELSSDRKVRPRLISEPPSVSSSMPLIADEGGKQRPHDLYLDTNSSCFGWFW